MTIVIGWKNGCHMSLQAPIGSLSECWKKSCPIGIQSIWTHIQVGNDRADKPSQGSGDEIRTWLHMTQASMVALWVSSRRRYWISGWERITRACRGRQNRSPFVKPQGPVPALPRHRTASVLYAIMITRATSNDAMKDGIAIPPVILIRGKTRWTTALRRVPRKGEAYWEYFPRALPARIWLRDRLWACLHGSCLLGTEITEGCDCRVEIESSTRVWITTWWGERGWRWSSWGRRCGLGCRGAGGCILDLPYIGVYIIALATRNGWGALRDDRRGVDVFDVENRIGVCHCRGWRGCIW